MCNMYMSLVEAGESAKALKCLREDIQPLETFLRRDASGIVASHGVTSMDIEPSDSHNETNEKARDAATDYQITVHHDTGRTANSTGQSLSQLAAMLLDSSCASQRSHHPCPPKRLRDGEVNFKRQEKLLKDLQKLLSPDILMPDNRLEELVEQALDAQIRRCPYHNSRHVKPSLLEDYSAGPESLPTVPVHSLTLHTDEVWVVQFSPDGKWLLSASRDGSAILWNVQNSQNVTLSRVIFGGKAPINIGAFSPSSNEVLLGSGDGKLRVFDIHSGRKIAELQVGSSHENVSAAMWGNDSTKIASSCNKELRLLDISPRYAPNANVAYKTRLQQHGYDATLSADGGTFVYVGQDRMIRFIRFSDQKMIVRGPEPAAVTCLSRSSDGEYLASNLSNGCIHVWKLGNLECASSKVGNASSPFDESGSRSSDPMDALPTEPLYVLKGPNPSQPGRFVIRSAFGGADNAFVGTGSESSLVHIWHRESCKLLASVEGHTATVNAVAWNPKNDHMLASASDDHKVIIWMSKDHLVSNESE